MSVGFQHPRSKVHIGDGFKFLEERKNEFDVIITDSSDPEGPAEVLFQKPYFELLHGALREGGVISTQGCSSPFHTHTPLHSGPDLPLSPGSGFTSCYEYDRHSLTSCTPVLDDLSPRSQPGTFLFLSRKPVAPSFHDHRPEEAHA